jgi:hypothetical protein
MFRAGQAPANRNSGFPRQLMGAGFWHAPGRACVAKPAAENQFATVEDLSEEELEELHEQYRRYSEEALIPLNRRRGDTLERAG